MKGDDHAGIGRLRHGPLVWGLSAGLGLGAGALFTRLIPAQFDGAGRPEVPLVLVAPFVVLLASIALMPFVSQRVWHRHFPDFSFGLGGVVAGYYLMAYGGASAGHGLGYGQHAVLHAAAEYYSFIALVGGLFVVSGGILIETRGRAGPVANALLMCVGAVLANIVGTTGAAVLLVRPFMRTNEGRLRPLHVVMFIFLIANCGGCLTPIGDPPLYLGFLKGVPFLWTIEHLWADWLVTVGPLLAVFLIIDVVFARRDRASAGAGGAERTPVRFSIRGIAGVVCLVFMVAGVFIDPMLDRKLGISGWPIGATFQVLVAGAAYLLTPRSILSGNEFSFFPVKEVGILFAGIFLTMIPALGYLSAHGAALGLSSPTSYYFATGGLSAVLDNAPTYLNFLQVAVSPGQVTEAAIRRYLAEPGGALHVRAISTGAVFFGAMTYIGNGPNFMVRAMAEGAGVKMPSFFGYLGYAVIILLPILAIHWAVLIR